MKFLLLAGVSCLAMGIAHSRAGEVTQFPSWPTFRNGPQNSGVSAFSVKRFIDTAVTETTKPRTIRKFQTGGLVWGTPVLDENGNTYVGAANKWVYSLDSQGQLRWSYRISDLPDSLIDSAAAVIPGADLLIVPGGDGFLHALDRKTGTLRWKFQAHHTSDETHRSGKTVNSFEGNVQVGPGNIIYAGSDNGYLYAVDVNGQELWSLKTNMMVWSSPVLSPNGKWLAFGSLDGYLYLVDPLTGKLLDRWHAKADIKSSPTIDENGNIYFGNSNGVLSSLKILEKKPGRFQFLHNWSFEAGGEIYSSPSYHQGRLYFGTLEGKFYSLSSSGTSHWIYTTHSPISSSPLVTQDGVVLFGAKNGKLYALNAASGERVWSYRSTTLPMKSNLDSSPSLDGDGFIHVGSYQGWIYSIPYEYCLTVPLSAECETGGHTDLPDFSRNLDPNSATLQLISPPQVGSGETIQLRLAVMNQGDLVDEAAIDATSRNLQVSITPEAEVQVQVSSDGKLLNITPKTFLAPNTSYQIKVHGLYYKQTRSWFRDRFQYFGRKPFHAEVEVKTQEALTSFLDSPKPGQTFTWGLNSFYLQQPAALDTYMPAALDGQSFLVTAFNLKPGSALLVVFPAVATVSGLEILPESSKVFALNGRFQGNSLKGFGTFDIAGMGGEFTFDPFTFALNFNSSGSRLSGQMNATASCLKIRGNGSQYSFPFQLINQVCDPWMNVIAIGTFEGLQVEKKIPEGTSLVDTKKTSRTLEVTVHIGGPRAPHLLTLVQYDSEKNQVVRAEALRTTSEEMDSRGRVRKTFSLKTSSGLSYSLFLDTQPI